jgi:transcription elongation GreA/GreB family factor
VKERIVYSIVGDEEIHPTIQVEIREPYSHALTGMSADSTLRRDVFKGSVALIEE